MANARVARGRRTEAAVAAYLAQHGWPHAERVPASLPGSDITGTPDVAIEVKARSDFHPRAWLAQAQKAADGRLPIAVVRCNGQGEQAGDYLAMVTFADLVTLLLEAGYGDKASVGEQPLTWGIWKGGAQVALMHSEQAARTQADSPIHGGVVVHFDPEVPGWIDDEDKQVAS